MLMAGGLAVVLARQAGVRGRMSFAAVAVVPVVVACVLALPAVRDSFRSLGDQRKAGEALSRDDARVRGGAALGVDVGFLGWAHDRLGPGDTFYLVIGESASAEAVRQWGLYQLAPNLAVDAPRDADWVVLYGGRAGRGYPADKFERAQVYKPGFAIARRQGAS
jgi:hypothetical protein